MKRRSFLAMLAALMPGCRPIVAWAARSLVHFPYHRPSPFELGTLCGLRGLPDDGSVKTSHFPSLVTCPGCQRKLTDALFASWTGSTVTISG